MLINDEIFHLFQHVQYTEDDFFIPAYPFIKYVKQLNIMNDLTIDSMGESIVIAMPTYNILSYSMLNKGNGYSLDIHTTKTFEENFCHFNIKVVTKSILLSNIKSAMT